GDKRQGIGAATARPRTCPQIDCAHAGRTHLTAYRNVPAADVPALELLLVKLAQLVADFPEIREIDLNPVLADETGIIAVDARVAVEPIERRCGIASGHPRLSIRPYPKEWERQATLPDGSAVFVRPVRPEDERLYGPFLAA